MRHNESIAESKLSDTQDLRLRELCNNVLIVGAEEKHFSFSIIAQVGKQPDRHRQ